MSSCNKKTKKDLSVAQRQLVVDLCKRFYLKGTNWLKKVIQMSKIHQIIISPTGVRKILKKWSKFGIIFMFD